MNREFGVIDPTFLFTWPIARVFAVVMLDSLKPKPMTPTELLAWVNRKRSARGEEPLAELPNRGANSVQ